MKIYRFVEVEADAPPGESDGIQTECHARLISAAPELLAACKAFYLAECEKFGADIFTPDAQPDSPVQKAWLLAKSAISKATGKGEA